jgi:hypothetical protein
MAAPSVASTVYGQLATANTYEHTIPLPSGLIAGDVIICFITCDKPSTAITLDTTSSSNFSTGGVNEIYRSYMYNIVNYDFNITYAFVKAVALGGGLDSLKVKTYLIMYNWGDARDVSEYIRNSKLSYVCYRITNARIYYYIPSNKVWHFSGNDLNWNIGRYPSHALDTTDDSLWILGVGSRDNKVATAAPSGWSSLVKTTGSLLSPGTSSTSTCYIQTTAGQNQIDPGAFTAPSSQYAGTLIRLYDIDQTTPPIIDPPETITEGFYVPMYRKEAYIDNGIEDYIETYISEMRFSDNTDACNAGNLAIINSNGAWTAAWTDNIDFNASVMSGISGTTYLYITCKNINTSGDILSDILTITCGVASISISVYQNSVGNGCTW